MGITEKQVQNPIEKELESPVENEAQNSEEQEVEKVVDKPIKKYRIIVASIVTALCTLLVFYFVTTLYFINHFYFDSEINAVNVSGKYIADVEVIMVAELQNYSLNLKELGGKSEQIKASDVGLAYNSEEEFRKLKDSQNPFKWSLACFNTEDSKMTVAVTYDEKLLKERIDKLSCFDSSNIIEPKNPSFQYIDSSYVIIDEIPGNKVDKDILYSHVVEALLNRKAEIDLESIQCYIKPQYNSKLQKVLEVNDTLNKYASSEVTYTFGKSNEVLEGFTINKWLTVDENLEVVFEQKKVEEYIDHLSIKYNIAGMTRNFITSSGETIQIGGGDFSRPIDKVKENQNLVSDIKQGRTITKEPAYDETGFSYGNSGIGNTYVEIDLTNQHIWFYKNGSLVVDGDIVTGNISTEHTTPIGVYSLKYKVKDAVLRGPGYASPVRFWMPFNGGIGMHDANWRSVFGGNIYKTSGSHGCINCPDNVAKAIYNDIEPNTPVICY